MWQQGQGIAAGYNQQATQIHADAASASASQASQNNANDGQAIKTVVGIGASLLYGSDERIKKNISKDGDKTFAGYQLYKFEYKNPNIPGFRKGVMAQDVLKKDADMIHVDNNGHYMVDYGGLYNRYKKGN